MEQPVTEALNFYEGNTPAALLREYGSPLYVYNERILRQNCRDVRALTDYPDFVVHYSMKANSNPALLRVVREEGLWVDTMSPGEIYAAQLAGFPPERIFFVPNNIDDAEMRYAIQRGILTSVDSLSQLARYGRLNPGGPVAVRFNPGVGAGHHAKVVTGGKATKFGVNPEEVPAVKALLAEYGLRLTGLNQHIGSLFMTPETFLASFENLAALAAQFENLEFLDLGGGFGIPYRKQAGEARLNLRETGRQLSGAMARFAQAYGRALTLKLEPGRYIPAEAGVLLGTVHAVKQNSGRTFVGTDIGMNVLMRPVLYDAHHDLEVYPANPQPQAAAVTAVTVVGNICESGDILAKDRDLPPMAEGDALGVLDAGAYGHSMSSCYNLRPRAAEVLLRPDGAPLLIRRRDSFEDLVRNYLY
jgi:diaminopimelate decarboxylase